MSGPGQDNVTHHQDICGGTVYVGNGANASMLLATHCTMVGVLVDLPLLLKT